ncbi:MAG TPA: hypothetical protein VG708_15515 [Mycobacteriales bacterium]|nr:hypothetical protein [Mycobacteriales bacterium]
MAGASLGSGVGAAATALAGLDRTQLAALGREWLLHGHLQDRVGMPLLLEITDREGMQAVAIEEWMVASPIYSRRMQRALNFEGHGVDTICKNLQFDIGAPHQFMDFRFRLIDESHAEFWLAHCGALMDVEPMGEDFVVGMCHAIEDPTFDATAAATNPLVQVRPIHRPPRQPADRMPHCHWRIDIVADGPAVTPHPRQPVLEGSEIARLPIPRPDAATGPGEMVDYAGPFDPDFQLDRLSRSALLAVLQEVALQSQLLLRSYQLAVAHRFGDEVADGLLPRVVAGWAGLTSERIRLAFGLPATASGLATAIRLHPLFQPSAYIGMAVEQVSERELRLAFGDCPALAEHEPSSWVGELGIGAKTTAMDDALGAVLRGFDPRVRCLAQSPGPGEKHTYRVTLDLDAEPLSSVPELELARISTGARFRLTGGRRG